MAVVVFDLDGTLLDSDNQIVGGQTTIELLKKLKQENYKLAICTGRLDHDVVAIDQKYDLKINHRISENGAVFYQGDQVHATVLNKDDAQAINSYLENFDDIRVEMNTISNRYWKSPRDPDFPKEFYDSSIIKKNFSKVIPFQPIILFLVVGEKKRLQEIQKNIVGKFENVNAILTSNTSLEIVSKDVSKGLAVKKMFPKEKVYSIGDSESDLSMKKYSEEMFYTGAEKIPGIISVKNITEALKKIRDEDYESTVSSVR